MTKNKGLLIITLLTGNILMAQTKQLSEVIVPNKVKNFTTYKTGNSITAEQLVTRYKNELGLSENDAFSLVRKENDQLGFTHSRYQQVYKGIPVYGAHYLVHEKNQEVVSSNGRLVKGITANNTASITANDAVQNAINYVNASKYMWDDQGAEARLKQIKNDPFVGYYPKAELVYFDKYFTQVGSNFKLAYKIEVYAQQPLSKQDIFIDAVTGQIIHAYNKLHTTEVTGTANTKYAGTQSIQTDSTAPGAYRLREYARGGGIETYNMLQGTNYGNAVDFTDGDNVWNNVNAQQDEAATDAHWAAEMTYDYYLGTHGRDSYDNAGTILLSFVHYDVNYSNAFWDGTQMTYGDGDGSSYTALTSLDVGGHEITHGVTEYSANLIYQNEPGALNESFSDIFGTCIEYYADPINGDWFIGEDFDLTGNGFRSMSDPNSVGDPDTYLGNNWVFTAVDNGGVHTNSSVQNYWFYLLSVGGSGVNDNGDSYNVTGIGMDSAAAIAYRNLSVYLTQSSQYMDARIGAIQSAEDLYGVCSPAVIEVSKAWAAVGVGFPIEDNDLTVVSVESPFTACGLSNAETVTIKIRNNGCLVDLNPGDTIPVAYQLDGGPVVNELFIIGTTFSGGDTLAYSFTATADFSTVGMHNLNVWTNYGLDPQSTNDSIVNLAIEHKLQQNIDVAMVDVVSPTSGCHLSGTENVQVAIQFLGCDSLTAGTNIDLGYSLNGGPAVNETFTLPTTMFPEDTAYYTFTATANIAANQTHSFDAWTAFVIDTINGNDNLNGYTVKHPFPLFHDDKVTFENNVAVLDTMILTDNVESDVAVSNASAASGTYALRMTGGDPINSGIIPDLDSNGFWTKNMEFAGFAKFCVDASTWSAASMFFDLRQTMSMIYNFQFGQPVPEASSMRIVVDGNQIGGTYNPVTEINDPFVTYQVNLNAYAGTQFEVVFETRMGFSEAADIMSGFPFYSEGDNAYIDNVRFSMFGVGVDEVEANAIESLSVYPNPNNGNFTLLVEAADNQTVKMEIINVLGSVIVSENKDVIMGTNELPVNINNQPNGIYFVKIITGANTNVVRVIKN